MTRQGMAWMCCVAALVSGCQTSASLYVEKQTSTGSLGDRPDLTTRLQLEWKEEFPRGAKKFEPKTPTLAAKPSAAANAPKPAP